MEETLEMGEMFVMLEMPGATEISEISPRLTEMKPRGLLPEKGVPFPIYR